MIILLFGRSWLRVFPLNWVNIFRVMPIQPPKLKALQVLQSYPKLFQEGAGKLEGISVRLPLASNATPIFHKARMVPYALFPAVEEEIKRLVTAGYMESVSHSNWATPIVPVIKKNGKVRLCGDYKVTVNKFLQMEHYPPRKIEDICNKLRGGQKYSKIDVNEAYLHVSVHEADREPLTLNTHIGLFRPTRMMYGISSGPNIWQRLVDEIVRGIEGCEVFQDDIVITAPNDQVHLERLNRVLSALEKAGLRINKDKCVFFADFIEYCGFTIDSKGIHKSEDKILAIKEAPQPKNISELRAFIGFIQYYSRFTDKLAQLAHPLYQLHEKNAKFVWTTECQQAFVEIKREMMSDRFLVPYDPELPLSLATDASPYGISSVLSHTLPDGTERPVAYYSKHLSKTEQRYSQLDKEALAIKCSVQKFFQYLFGRRFTLITDSKPLVSIFAPDKSLPVLSATRMVHYAIFLMGFQYDIQYRNTKDHGNADGLSRLPRNCEEIPMLQTSLIESLEEEPIRLFHTHQLRVLPVTHRDIASSTKLDPELQPLLNMLEGKVPQMSKFGKVPIEEFSVQDGIIMRGHRVVIPSSERKSILRELHQGHFGTVRMKSLARSYVWWSTIDQDISEITKSCLPCIHNYTAPPRAELHPWEPPNAPWQRIHIDFGEPKNSNKVKLMIVVDAYSKWPEVFIMKNTTAKSTIENLREIFSRYGAPSVLFSDNGPPFHSHDFQEFLAKHGIIHKTSAPYNPESNGQVERYVQTIKYSLMKACEEAPGESLHENLHNTLIQYRIMKHSTTGESPCKQFLNREIKTKLDLLRPPPPRCSSSVERAHKFQCGERVAARNYGSGKKWRVGTISKILGTRNYILSLGTVTWKRHQNQLRKVNEDVPEENLDCENPFLHVVPRNGLVPHHQEPEECPANQPRSPRPQRIRKPPDRYSP